MIKVSFGMIVFNAESTLPLGMLEKCIKNVYEYAHEILIVEGATSGINPNGYCDGNAKYFTNNGKSTDRTIAIIRSISDPDKKIKLWEAQGFWNGKTSMCNKYAENATGDYIWQLDSDEFYYKEDMEKIINILSFDRTIDSVHFYANHFFGDFQHYCDETCNKWANQIPWKRVFKHSSGSKWLSHEPPVYLFNDDGNMRNLDYGNILTRDTTLLMGIKMFHYSCVGKSQVDFKTSFFGNKKYEEYWKEFKKGNRNLILFGDELKEYRGFHPEIIKGYVE